MREAQTMRQQLHPNVLPLYTSFVHEQNLWMVMPYVSSGSVLNIMKYAHPEVRAEPCKWLVSGGCPRRHLLRRKHAWGCGFLECTLATINYCWQGT